jgi:hypothetical protein
MAKDHGLWVIGLIILMVALLNTDGWSEAIDNRKMGDN